MMKNVQHYATLAALFRYPKGDLRNKVKEADQWLEDYGKETRQLLVPFMDFISNTTMEEQQEYFSATYDVQPLSTLDIGYVLFGDDYKRGVFLVHLKTEHLRASNDCGSELPDHLPCILDLLTLMKDKQLAEELVCSILIPSVEELIKRFKNRENHYRSLLVILLKVLMYDFPSNAYEKFQFNINEAVK